MIRLFCLLVALLLIVPKAFAFAPCPVVEAQTHSEQQLSAMRFDKSLDLVIMQKGQTHRITFGAAIIHQLSEQCPLTPLALAQGGDWGWHVLWQSAKGLFYARVDGEAWVSSNPKMLSKSAVASPQFKFNGQVLSVTWQQAENGSKTNMQAASSDEGRSWEIAPATP